MCTFPSDASRNTVAETQIAMAEADEIARTRRARFATDDALLNALHWLADYPLLAALAKERTTATKLDGRACRFIYSEALPRIDWQAMSASELAFLRSLVIEG